MKKYYMVGNTHFDPVWLWRWDEAAAAARATFRAALERMEEDEGFIYSFSCPPVFEWVRRAEPELFARIAARVKEGRWDLCEGWWLQPDCCSASGESYVRQGLYGQKYLFENFGRRSRSAFNVDSFGHSGNLPQILRKSRINSYCFMRPEERHYPLENRFFTWQGIDGTEIPTFRAQGAFCKKVSEAVAAQPDESGDTMIIYGVTDHGGAPTKAVISEINSRPDTVFSTVEGFFDSQPKPEYTVKGELLTGDFGNYSNLQDVKKLNREAEYSVLNAERASLLAGVDARKALEGCWHDILFNTFHDILGGASIKEAYYDARNTYGRAIQTSQETALLSLQKITAKMKTAGTPGKDAWSLAVWNLNGKSFSGYIEAEVQWVHEFGWYGKGIAVEDADGCACPCAVIREKSVIPGFRSRFVFKAEIPPMGCKTFRVIQTNEELCRFEINPYVIETDRLKVEFSRSGGFIEAVYSKETGEKLSGRMFAPISRVDDGDTWCFNISGYGEKTPFEFTGFEIAEANEIRTIIKGNYRFRDSLLEMYYKFYERESYLDISYRVNWNEKHRAFKLECETTEKTLFPAVPYGFVEREERAADVPMNGWLNAGNTGIIADGIFSYDFSGGKIGLTVLRSPIHGDLRIGELPPAVDYDFLSQGVNEGKLRLLFGKADPEKADAFMNPPVVIAESPHGGELPSTLSFFSKQGEGVSLGCLKRCEFDDSVILRFCEYRGKNAEITFSFGGSEHRLSFSPFEIRTFKLENGALSEIYMTEDGPLL
ncbi:MAG: glycoside hydrolase family 38 C-terminal domain-containing protein [Eubacteriales bacterium]|jgi:alpha-mannosidase